MINKIVQDMADAMTGIKDGSTVLIGGFGAVGQPNALIDGLIHQGAKDLTVAANNAGVGHTGLARLMELGRVRRIICSFPRSSDPVVFETLYRAGKIELEIVPQGTLAERMRAAGAGVPAFFTATGVGTKMAVGKEHREIDGRTYILEQSLPGDVALVEAWEADRWGNLTFREFRPQLQSGDGDGGDADHRADAARAGTGRDQCGSRRDAGHLRGSRAARAVRGPERVLNRRPVVGRRRDASPASSRAEVGYAADSLKHGFHGCHRLKTPMAWYSGSLKCETTSRLGGHDSGLHRYRDDHRYGV